MGAEKESKGEEISDIDLKNWVDKCFNVKAVIIKEHCTISLWIANNISEQDSSNPSLLKGKIETLSLIHFSKKFEKASQRYGTTEIFKQKAKPFLLRIILLEIVNNGLLDRSFREVIKKALGLK